MLVWTKLPDRKGDAGETVEGWEARLPYGDVSVATVQGPTRYNRRFRALATVRWKDAEFVDCASLDAAQSACTSAVALQFVRLGVKAL